MFRDLLVATRKASDALKRCITAGRISTSAGTYVVLEAAQDDVEENLSNLITLVKSDKGGPVLMTLKGDDGQGVLRAHFKRGLIGGGAVTFPQGAPWLLERLDEAAKTLETLQTAMGEASKAARAAVANLAGAKRRKLNPSPPNQGMEDEEASPSDHDNGSGGDEAASPSDHDDNIDGSGVDEEPENQDESGWGLR
jgi:hypothetical protein